MPLRNFYINDNLYWILILVISPMQFKVIKDTTNHISAPVSYIKHRNIESFETLRETAEWDKWWKIESE